MTTIIRRSITSRQLSALLKGRKGRKTRRKGVDVKSFAGKLKFAGDPVRIQRRMRDGWR